MDLTNYCEQMASELTQWKAKLYDTVRKIKTLGPAEQDKVSSNIKALHHILDEISQRVDTLRTECPSDWSPIKENIEQQKDDLQKKYEAMQIYISTIP